MATKPSYTVTLTDGTIVGTPRARKESAIKLGDETGVSYTVVSASGKVVHEVTVKQPTKAPAEEPTEAPAEEPAESEPVDVAAEAAELAGAESAGKFDAAKMKSKISKLLTKADKTDNADERAVYTEAAERLMLKLGIGIAELESTGDVKPEKVVEVSRTFTGIYSDDSVELLYAMSRGFGNITVLFSRVPGRRQRTAFVIGLKTDVATFMTLFDSVHLQAHSALAAYKRELRVSKAPLDTMQRYRAYQNFLSGFSSRVRARLAELRYEVEEEATPGAALVLASKQSRIDSYMENAYPDVKPDKSKSKVRYYESIAAGRVAGDKADLGQTRIDSRKAVSQ